MSFIEALLLAVALAMDCFTVSITCGIIQRRMGRQALAMALLFGFFQALMPLLGWLAANLFSKQITAYDHWVAFGLLTLLGGKMIWEGFQEKEHTAFNPSRPAILVTLAIATSIDALAVGFSFIGMGLRSIAEIVMPVATIGITSFLFSIFGKYVGVSLGRRFNWPAEQIGGSILILIGLKVLIEHLSA